MVPGAVAMSIALVIAGATSYGFLVVSARALGADEYAPLSVLWALVILVGPGAFLPLEQEVTRAVAARRVVGEGARPLILRAALLGGGLLGILLVVGAATGPLMTDELFEGNGVLTAALLLSLLGYAAAHLAKGTLSGNGRFGAYARFTAVESAARFALCAALALIGADDVAPYALAVGIAPLLGVAAALPTERGLLEPGPPAPWSELWAALGALLAGSMLSFALVNLGPLAVQLLDTSVDGDEAGRFLVALVVARVPLFLFQAVQAALLPRLSELARLGDLEGLRRGLGRVLLGLSAFAVVGTVGAAVVGSPVVRLVFGSEYEVGARTMALLSAASGLYMVATAVAQANIALSAHARAAWAWSAGVLAFGLGLLVSDDLFLRVEIASVLGSVAALAAQLLVLQLRSRAHEAINRDDALEAAVDRPPLP
jgi:O-antigen/teichoic acid export membrane protein